jgi:hypothetical protein
MKHFIYIYIYELQFSTKLISKMQRKLSLERHDGSKKTFLWNVAITCFITLILWELT